MAEHKSEVHHFTHECKFCGKQFKLRFSLNRLIQKNHNSMYKCRICRLPIDCSKYIEHEEYHERKDNIISITKATPYFCVRNLPDIKNGFSDDDYEQTSQNKLFSFYIYTFNSQLCSSLDSPYDQSSTAKDLKVSTVQSNILETESNTFDPINSRNTEPQVMLNSINIEDSNTESATMSKSKKKKLNHHQLKKRISVISVIENLQRAVIIQSYDVETIVMQTQQNIKQNNYIN
ncbi:hypothetical protein QTP88_007743 [Uroleucon formosanum]